MLNEFRLLLGNHGEMRVGEVNLQAGVLFDPLMMEHLVPLAEVRDYLFVGAGGHRTLEASLEQHVDDQHRNDGDDHSGEQRPEVDRIPGL